MRTVIVAPIASKSRAAPFRVPLTHAGTKGLILLDQIRTVDKVRLIKPLGRVSAKVLGHTLQTLLALPLAGQVHAEPGPDQGIAISLVLNFNAPSAESIG